MIDKLKSSVILFEEVLTTLGLNWWRFRANDWQTCPSRWEASIMAFLCIAGLTILYSKLWCITINVWLTRNRSVLRHQVMEVMESQTFLECTNQSIFQLVFSSTNNKKNQPRSQKSNLSNLESIHPLERTARKWNIPGSSTLSKLNDSKACCRQYTKVVPTQTSSWSRTKLKGARSIFQKSSCHPRRVRKWPSISYRKITINSIAKI